jgi:hypothetical protein
VRSDLKEAPCEEAAHGCNASVSDPTSRLQERGGRGLAEGGGWRAGGGSVEGLLCFLMGAHPLHSLILKWRRAVRTTVLRRIRFQTQYIRTRCGCVRFRGTMRVREVPWCGCMRSMYYHPRCGCVRYRTTIGVWVREVPCTVL